jgi:hypothetical protein
VKGVFKYAGRGGIQWHFLSLLINFHKGGYLSPNVITRDKRPAFFYMAEIILKPVENFQILRNQLTYKKQNYYKIEGNKISPP